MDDFNQTPDIEVSGAGGGKQKRPKIKQTVIVRAPTRQPVEEANNIFSVAFAKSVYALSEGEVEGFPNSIEKDVYLDGVPIQNPDGSENYQGYVLDSRLGEDETQTPITGFSQTENTIGVNIPVTQATGAITRTITDLDTERCRVIISHPVLLAQDAETGDITGTSVSYKIEFNSNGGPYTTVIEPIVTGKSNSEFQRAYEFDLTGTGPWNIRVERLTADSSSSLISNAIAWQSYVEIVDEKFAYPATALVALKVDARQFNTIPDVSVKLRGKRVQVPSNYDAATRTYTGLWDGTFQMAWTDNPAWIFRDIVINERFGVRRYINSIAIDPWYLYTVSQYCDELVPDGAGGTEPRFTCNVYLQNPGSVYEVLNALASCFRGLVYYSEGQLYVTQDRSSLPVQQFSEANVIQDVAENGEVASPCFTYTGSARAARKTVVLANWDDPNQVYSTVTEYLQDDELLEKLGYNPVDLRLLGVTSRGQALRAAKHTLFSDRYETDKVSFRIGAEGLAAGVGEIIQIADPVRQGQRLGGRIKAIDGQVITIDAVLTLSPTTDYTLTLVVPNGETVTNGDGTTSVKPKLQVLNVISSAEIGFEIDGGMLETQTQGDALLTQAGETIFARYISTDGTTTRFELSGNVDSQVGALWVLEWDDLQAATYRVVSVAEVEPLIYQVEAIQYNDSKYGYVDNDLPIAIPKDRFTVREAVPPTDLTAKLEYSNGQASIKASWKAPQFNNSIDLLLRGYRYQWRKVGDTQWSEILQLQDSTVESPLAVHVFGNEYQVRVATVNRLGSQSDWEVYDVDPFDPIPDLSDPAYGASVSHANQPDGTQLLIVNPGTAPIPERVNGYRCWIKPRILGSGEIPGVKEPNAEGWYFLADIPLTGYYTIAFHAPDTYDVRVNFTSSIYGEEPTDYIFDFVERGEITPPKPSNFSVVENKDSSGKRFSWQLPLTEYGSWDQNVVTDVTGYEVRFKRGTLVSNVVDFDVDTDLISIRTGTVTGTILNQHLLAVDDEIVFSATSGSLPTGIAAGLTYFVSSEGFTSTAFKVSTTVGGATVDITGTATGVYTVSGPSDLADRLNSSATWAAGIELASGGLPAQQQWFETSLFDVDSWVVMVKAVDATQWRSDVPAYVLVNITAPPAENAVQTIDAKTASAPYWPGTYINCEVDGSNNLVQTDPTEDSLFIWNFDNNNLESALLLSTTATATYQHSLVALTGADLELVQEDDFNILQEDDTLLLAEQRFYNPSELSEGGIVHPYAPYEKLLGDVYRVETRFKSADGGVTAGEITALTAQLDYPDVIEKQSDVAISNTGTAVSLTKAFRSVESVQITAFQTGGSTAVTAYVTAKSTSSVTIECRDSAGALASGLVDITVVGY